MPSRAMKAFGQAYVKDPRARLNQIGQSVPDLRQRAYRTTAAQAKVALLLSCSGCGMRR